MPRHYTDTEKRLVLDRLVANHGNIPRTVEETGVPMRTIYNWQKDANLPLPILLPNLPTASSSPSLQSEEGSIDLPTETTEAFQILHDQLLAIAKILANRIVEAIDDAPLNQRMTALSQLIDRIAKLAALLPDDPDPSATPFDIDFDVQEKDDAHEEENETINPSTGTPSESEEDFGKPRPF